MLVLATPIHSFPRPFPLGTQLMGLTLHSAMSGIVGYPLKGIDVAITKGWSEKIFLPIFGARMAQGELEYLAASEEEKKEIIDRWVEKMGPKKESRKGKELAEENQEKYLYA